MTPAALLDPIADLAVAAGRAILAVYGSDFAVATKADQSPVTEADAEGERIILAGLAGLAPDIPVVAEEACSEGHVPQVGGRFFLVDPLDGTREFIARNGEFTVNIALIDDGVPVLGVVYAPALGRIHAGAAGAGAWIARVEADRIVDRRPIRVRLAPEAGLAAVGSRSHGSAETEAWLKTFPVVSFVSAGSSLKFCLVASGEADLYPRLGRTMEWDIAAGDAVLRAAGGLVTTLDGVPMAYGKCRQTADADFANPHFIAWGDPSLRAKV
jgi:3'(2'),5'-bisphosphate nucleotidase